MHYLDLISLCTLHGKVKNQHLKIESRQQILRYSWTICEENNIKRIPCFQHVFSSNLTHSWSRPAGRTLAPLRPASPRAWNWTLGQIARSCLVQTRAVTSSVFRVSCDGTRSCLPAIAACHGARLPATPRRNLERIRKILLNDFVSNKSMNTRTERFSCHIRENLSGVSCSLVLSNQLVKSTSIFSKAYIIRNYFIAEILSQKLHFLL